MDRGGEGQKATADPSTPTRAIAPYTAGTHDSRFAMEEKARASPLGMTGLGVGREILWSWIVHRTISDFNWAVP